MKMQYQLQKLVALSMIDLQLDELEEEFGDLPDQVKAAEKKVKEKRSVVEETDAILSDVRKFKSSAKLTISQLKDKEEKLSKQQFLVRNNKEFDAITKEIETVKFEYNKLTDEMRTVGIKEENLVRMLEQQKKEWDFAKRDLDQLLGEIELISKEQVEEVKELKDKRKKVSKDMKPENKEIYKRIRNMFADAIVKIKKNSCSGCFSLVPPQKIVEIRNNMDKIYFCENCGRVLFPEELDINL